MIAASNQDGSHREIQTWAEDGKLVLGVYQNVPGEAETLLTIEVTDANELFVDLAGALEELDDAAEEGSGEPERIVLNIPPTPPPVKGPMEYRRVVTQQDPPTFQRTRQVWSKDEG